ncbi:FtsK/SpoIIIE domain-containing protein [Enterococcus sp. DIV1420a]|uniref:FtsK/SpoIIIE domain-containing protein n=1 Tax=Enterococcus sp. DIV1420a TaxID=2774672 RepID=UPI003F687AC8
MSQLIVEENQTQLVYKKRHRYFLLIKTWIILIISLMIISNYKNILSSISQRQIIWDSQILKMMLLVLFLHFLLTVLWEFFHSHYSPIEKWKLEKLLRGFTEESDLLRQHDSSFHQTKSVKWLYSMANGQIKITLKAGGHLASSMENDISRRLQGYLIKETKSDWIIEDRYISSGKITTIFSHEHDERIIIDNLSDLKQTNEIEIPLTRKLTWTSRQPMGLVVGPTGSGKTSFLKALIISFLANNSKNKVFTIDGKASFLSVAMKRVGKVATDGQSALELTKELCHIMEKRYSQMNADVDSEKDCTHAELFEQGTILLVADELLALVGEMQASDKLLKPAERLYPQFYANLMNLIVKGRQSSISVIVSGQMMPASILPTESRDSLGLRIALGRLSQQQAQEIFGLGLKDLPRVDTSNYGGLIWLDGFGWELPKPFLSPYYDDNKLPFKITLSKLSESHGGGLPQAE